MNAIDVLIGFIALIPFKELLKISFRPNGNDAR